MPKPSKKEADFILAEGERLKAFGARYGVRLCGFDHLGSPYGPPYATYAHAQDDERHASVTLPYWFIEQLSATMAAAVDKEREACAKLIEALPAGFGDKNRNDVATMIRNRTA